MFFLLVAFSFGVCVCCNSWSWFYGIYFWHSIQIEIKPLDLAMQPIAPLLLLLIYCLNRTWAALYAHFVALKMAYMVERKKDSPEHTKTSRSNCQNPTTFIYQMLCNCLTLMRMFNLSRKWNLVAIHSCCFILVCPLLGFMHLWRSIEFGVESNWQNANVQQITQTSDFCIRNHWIW